MFGGQASPAVAYAIQFAIAPVFLLTRGAIALDLLAADPGEEAAMRAAIESTSGVAEEPPGIGEAARVHVQRHPVKA